MFMFVGDTGRSIPKVYDNIFKPLCTIRNRYIISNFSFEIQRFADSKEKSGIWVVKTLIKLTTTYKLTKFAKEFAEAENLHTFLKDYANPFVNFIATFWNAESDEKTNSTLLNIAGAFSGFVGIINDADDIIKEKENPTPNLKKINTSMGDAAKNLINMTTSLANLNLNCDKTKLILSIISAGLGTVCSTLVLIDGVDEKEKENLNKAYVGLLKTVSKEIVKNIFQTETVDQILSNTNILEKMATKFTKGGGPLDLIFAALTGVMNGFDEYFERRDQYIAEDIPENIAKHDAIIDAIAKFVYETAHSYTKGLDDVIYNSVGPFISWLTQTDTSLDRRNYIEVIADLFKILNYKNSGTKEDDKLFNNQSNIYVYGNYGNDHIQNWVSNATIWGGYGDDTISNENIFDYNSILAGPGNDIIVVRSNHNTVYGGTGEDKFYILDGQNKINGGLGDDTIAINIPDSLRSETNSVRIEYAEGDGYDTVFGFGAHDTLHITKGAYSTTRSDSDVIVTVGDGSIRLKNVTDNPIQIICDNAINGTSENDSIMNYYWGGRHDVFIYGLSGDDFINNYNKNVTIKAGSGNDLIKNYDGTNTFGRIKSFVLIDGEDGADVIESQNQLVDNTIMILGGDGDDAISSYNVVGSTTVEGGMGNDTITLSRLSYCGNNVVSYIEGDGNDIIRAFNSTDTLHITAATCSTIQSDRDLIVKVGAGSITLKDTANANIVFNKTITWIVSDTTATGRVVDRVITEITGLKKGAIANDFSVNDSVISIAQHALGTSKVSITGDYTLALGEDVTCSEITTTAGFYIDGTTATYKTLGRTTGYFLADDAKSITYTKAVASKNLATVTGLKSGVSTDDLTLSGKNVTVSTNALGTSKVSISSGYNLILGSDVTKSQTIAAGWNISGTTATYKTKEITAGYVLASNKKSVTYNSASGGDVLTTVTGLKSGTLAKNIPINTKTKTVTLNKAALDTGTVSVSGDYKLALGSDVKNKSKTTAAHFEVSSTTAKYVSTKITAGYSLATDKKSVSYISTTSGGDTLATITGLKKGTKTTDLSISDDNVITISKAALATSTITVSDGYTLALANNISAPVFTEAGWSVSGTTAKYNSEKIVAGYTLADDKKSVNYTKSLASKTLVTVTGLVSGTTADKLSLKDNTVTLSGNIIGSKGATVNGKGYEFVLSSSAKITNAASNASLTGSSGNDTLIGSKYADYISSGLGGSDYISGGDGNDTLLGISDNCTLLGGNGNDYLSCDLEGNGSLVGGAGNDTLSACQGNVTLAGGKGNDVFKFVLNDNKNFNATITDYTVGQNKILLDSSVSISSTNVSGNDVILNVSNSKITLKNAKGKKITFIDENGKTTSNTYSKSSSSNVSELWFTADDTNFATSSAQIDSITKSGLSDYSLGNVDTTTDLMTLTQNDSLTSGLTFSDK